MQRQLHLKTIIGLVHQFKGDGAIHLGLGIMSAIWGNELIIKLTIKIKNKRNTIMGSDRH